MVEPCRDYHDYVFRDGELVAEFEEMYRNSAEVPWHQDQQEDWVDVRLTVEMLADLAPFDEIHDLGCGLGHYLAILRDRLGAPECRCFGFDISETAVSQAAERFPNFHFATLDLRKPSSPSGEHGGGSRLFTIRGTLWYVFPDLADVVATIAALMSSQDHLLIVQNFPPLDSDFIGKEVIADHDQLIERFADRFTPQRHLWYQDQRPLANDNWFVGLFARKDV